MDTNIAQNICIAALYHTICVASSSVASPTSIPSNALNIASTGVLNTKYPMILMNKNINNLEESIREYLLDEGLFQKPINDSKIKFGFQFTFPPISNPSEQKSYSMIVFQPQNKDLIIVSIGTQISKPHINALKKSKDGEVYFLMDLKKLFLLKNVFFRIDNDNYRYEISDQVFINQHEIISKNNFFVIVRKVYNIYAYSNLLLGDYCTGRINSEDLGKTQRFDTSLGFNLYT